MQLKALLGGLVGGAAALSLCLGCEAQVGEGYRGEAILTLQGSVELGDGATDDLVPVLAFPSGSGYALIDAHVEGEFPAHFRLSVFDPPPPTANRGPDGISYGFLTVLPKSHPSELPAVISDETGTRREGGIDLEQDLCTASNLCLHRQVSCDAHECPLLGETGSPIPPGHVVSAWGIGTSGEEHILEVTEECSSEHECHRVFRKCDLPNLDLYLWYFDFGTTGTCHVRSESGDSRVKLYESVRRSAVGYTVLYASEAASLPWYGAVPAGYSVFRTVEPDSDQAWIDSIICSHDTPESADCPVGVHAELVSPDEQLKLKLGYGMSDH